jgi:hypothetical protein
MDSDKSLAMSENEVFIRFPAEKSDIPGKSYVGV